MEKVKSQSWAEEVKELRRELGKKTQPEFGVLVGFASSTIANWEQGKSEAHARDKERVRAACAQARLASSPNGPMEVSDVSPAIRDDLSLLALALGDTFKSVLVRCARFGINQLDPDGSLRARARREQRREPGKSTG